MSTIFKKIIDKEIPAKIIYEDEQCLAFYDVEPKAPVHVLLIPKKEIKSMNEISQGDKSLMGHMMAKLPEITQKLGLSEEGYRLVCNAGEKGGQSVSHLHFHILGGRQMQWPPG